MRRADLEVGKEYLTSPSNEWESDQYVTRNRALLVDVGRWTSAGGYGFHHREAIPTVTLEDGTEVSGRVRKANVAERAPGVLVRMWNSYTDSWSENVVALRPQELRAPWDEGIARVNIAREARERRVAATQDEAANLRKRAKQAVESLGEAGKHIDLFIQPRHTSNRVEVSIVVRSVEGLEAIAEGYAKGVAHSE